MHNEPAIVQRHLGEQTKANEENIHNGHDCDQSVASQSPLGRAEQGKCKFKPTNDDCEIPRPPQVLREHLPSILELISQVLPKVYVFNLNTFKHQAAGC